MVHLLLHAGADPTATSESGRSPMGFVCIETADKSQAPAIRKLLADAAAGRRPPPPVPVRLPGAVDAKAVRRQVVGVTAAVCAWSEVQRVGVVGAGPPPPSWELVRDAVRLVAGESGWGGGVFVV